jgi:hypothetical protein
MILDEIQPGFDEQENFDSKIMMLSRRCYVGKEWEAECLLALYSFICNDGFIE